MGTFWFPVFSRLRQKHLGKHIFGEPFKHNFFFLSESFEIYMYIHVPFEGQLQGPTAKHMFSIIVPLKGSVRTFQLVWYIIVTSLPIKKKSRVRSSRLRILESHFTCLLCILVLCRRDSAKVILRNTRSWYYCGSYILRIC